MLDDVAHELEVVSGAADGGGHAGPDEGADGREVGGQRKAVVGGGGDILLAAGGSVEGVDQRYEYELDC